MFKTSFTEDKPSDRLLGFRALRIARGETIHDVATATGLAMGTVSAVERGLFASDEILERIARHLGHAGDPRDLRRPFQSHKLAPLAED